MLDENVSPAANQPDSRAVGQPLLEQLSRLSSQTIWGKGDSFRMPESIAALEIDGGLVVGQPPQVLPTCVA
eukprot:314769-Pelagomonas_calceolata.AAC.1